VSGGPRAPMPPIPRGDDGEGVEEASPMSGPLTNVLADDHTRLDGLLQRAMAVGGAVDCAAYAEFRAGLLRHISLEEKILLPAAQRLQGGDPLPVAATLRLDHGALAALLVPTPTPAIIAAIRTMLAAHNALEEGPGQTSSRLTLLGKSRRPRFNAWGVRVTRGMP
jgi:hypothetical protein